MIRRFLRRGAPAWLMVLAASASAPAAQARIDRHALVTRHNPTITAVDRHSAFMVGNGQLAFTADITGLQTFQDAYSPLVPLMTQAQWAWHSFPNPENFTLEQAMVPIDVRGVSRPFPWLASWDEARRPVIQWLRENPHRFSLARVGLRLRRADGTPARLSDLRATRQTLDLWTGRLLSRFTFEGAPVDVETSVHPLIDMLIFRVRSPLLADGRLGIDVKFPGVSRKLNPDPADWSNGHEHHTRMQRHGRLVTFDRVLDDTRYSVALRANRSLELASAAAHEFAITMPGAKDVTLLVDFSAPGRAERDRHSRADVARAWKDFWTRGAAVDFSGSTDPRARELERRVVLSQYLMAVNSAGRYPPQEEGLFSNSWNGKFHLEMHAWHAAHFAAWGRPELLERSMGWYHAQLPAARGRAAMHGVSGAWWPKMVGSDGRESPSAVNPFIMWQQPHPIYLAEAIHRARPGHATLAAHRELVHETAELLASWPHLDAATQRLVLGPPIIPAQENFPPLTTFNPTFELEYWRFGLRTAQRWRERLGMAREPRWDEVLAKLSPLPLEDGLYLAAESRPDLWERARSRECSKRATTAECPNRDHPSFVAAFGLLDGQVDRAAMARTLDAVLEHWDLRQTWGWDWPMLAMTAARLGQPGRAVDLLLSDARNFQFGVSGMTPRLHVAGDSAPHAAGADDVPGYRRVAETYFPSNGALLLAVALMAEQGAFPQDGTWRVRSEGLVPLP
jgi:hypothetical protein